MSTIHTAAAKKSNVLGVLNIVLEQIEGELVVSTHASQSLEGTSLASLLAPVRPAPALTAAPAKPVNVEPPAPPVAESKPAPQAETLESLKEKAKAAGVKGYHLYKDAAKLKDAIAAKLAESKPAPQATTDKPAAESKPRSGGGQGGGSKRPPMKKERHDRKTSSKAVVWNKDKTKELEVWIVREIKTPNFEGFLVCRPDDEDGLTEKHIYGATWAVPTTAFIRWID